MGLNAAQKKERSEYLERNLTITECSQRKPYVFISYASDNWETVFKTVVVPMQQQYGLRVYADKAFDKVNDKWIVPMLRNIRGADVIVAFVSQSYIESYACFLELLTAVNNKKQIVFVTLGDQLHLGDTTDQPEIELGVKTEIVNQGANIATNTNNTSNDIMRAMKSAYTSLSTLLRQDALSRYDISDAFINFFRDASINQKSVNDLKAIKRTIHSISRNVFVPAQAVSQPAPKPMEKAEPQTALVGQLSVSPAVPPEEETVTQSDSMPEPVQTEKVFLPGEPVTHFQPERPAEPGESGQTGGKIKKPLNVKLVLIGGAAAGILVLIFLLSMLGGGAHGTYPYTYGIPGCTSYPGRYTGDWKDGKPEGQGTFTGDDDGPVFEGTWASGLLNGDGMVKFKNGDSFEGEWKDGNYYDGVYRSVENFVYEGKWDENGDMSQGKMTWSNGNIYEGEWANGSLTQGKVTYTSGDIYEGECKNGFRNGQGTYYNANGDVYEGEWENDVFTHYGKVTYASGDIYEGEWENGSFTQGKATYASGNVYDGEWENGVWNGQGTMTYANGDICEGVWENGSFTRGKATYVTGNVYDGEWENDMWNGQGTVTYANGYVFDGEWENCKLNGQGTVTEPNGDSYEGVWQDGKLHGQVTYTTADGKSETQHW